MPFYEFFQNAGMLLIDSIFKAKRRVLSCCVECFIFFFFKPLFLEFYFPLLFRMKFKIMGCHFLCSFSLLLCYREFSKEKEKAESRGDFQKLRQKKQMEEDMEGYMDWLTQAEELDHFALQNAPAGQSLKVDVGKHKGDPVVMGLLKSTIFPLQQVLDGKRIQD